MYGVGAKKKPVVYCGRGRPPKKALMTLSTDNQVCNHAHVDWALIGWCLRYFAWSSCGFPFPQDGGDDSSGEDGDDPSDQQDDKNLTDEEEYSDEPSDEEVSANRVKTNKCS